MLLRQKACGFVLLLIAVAAGGVDLCAQDKSESPAPKVQDAPLPTPPSNIASQSSTTPSPDHNAEQEKNPKRILGIIPNFQTTNDTPQNRAPLTPRQKYALAWHHMFDFSVHFGNVIQAAMQQASNSDPRYGQGWGAFGQRFGAAEADQAVSSFLTFGFLPHLLKQDPRYFRRGKGSAWSRLHYAATRTVITRTDSGRPAFNASQVFGQLAQAGISRAYYPREDRNVAGTFESWGMNLAFTSGYNVLKEYYPDLVRVVFHRHHEPKASIQPAPQTNPQK
jgi:hypothetical protein